MSKTSKKMRVFQNSWNEGSLQNGIPKWRDPSKSEFQKGGIPPFRNSDLEGSNASPVFCKKCQAIVNALPVSLGFTNSKLHRRILMFAAYVKYWTIYHFSHSCKQRHLLAICLSDPSISEFRFGGIPPFRNSYLEGSLISEILKTPPFL